MINLRPDICREIRAARRQAGISQSALALEVGCKQSALSMFEQGAGTKLGEETIRKLAAKFGIKVEGMRGREQGEPDGRGEIAAGGRAGTGFCPNQSCPTNAIYEIDGRRLARPNRSEADPVGGKYCAFCGEVLERRCPNCGAPVHSGAICSICGEPYVACL